jgi:hypothetical protein
MSVATPCKFSKTVALTYWLYLNDRVYPRLIGRLGRGSVIILAAVLLLLSGGRRFLRSFVLLLVLRFRTCFGVANSKLDFSAGSQKSLGKVAEPVWV